jgi:hypothetical protein
MISNTKKDVIDFVNSINLNHKYTGEVFIDGSTIIYQPRASSYAYNILLQDMAISVEIAGIKTTNPSYWISKASIHNYDLLALWTRFN